MRNNSEALLVDAIQFLFTYIKFKSIYPELLPSFCANIPDDELLIRVMLNEEGLRQFSKEFNFGSHEKVLSLFYSILYKIEDEIRGSLKELNLETMVLN